MKAPIRAFAQNIEPHRLDRRESGTSTHALSEAGGGRIDSSGPRGPSRPRERRRAPAAGALAERAFCGRGPAAATSSRRASGRGRPEPGAAPRWSPSLTPPRGTHRAATSAPWRQAGSTLAYTTVDYECVDANDCSQLAVHPDLAPTGTFLVTGTSGSAQVPGLPGAIELAVSGHRMALLPAPEQIAATADQRRLLPLPRAAGHDGSDPGHDHGQPRRAVHAAGHGARARAIRVGRGRRGRAR